MRAGDFVIITVKSGEQRMGPGWDSMQKLCPDWRTSDFMKSGSGTKRCVGNSFTLEFLLVIRQLPLALVTFVVVAVSKQNSGWSRNGPDI